MIYALQGARVESYTHIRLFYPSLHIYQSSRTCTCISHSICTHACLASAYMFPIGPASPTRPGVQDRPRILFPLVSRDVIVCTCICICMRLEREVRTLVPCSTCMFWIRYNRIVRAGMRLTRGYAGRPYWLVSTCSCYSGSDTRAEYLNESAADRGLTFFHEGWSGGSTDS